MKNSVRPFFMPNYLVNYNVLITKRGFLGRFLTFFMPRPLFSLERLGIPLFHAKPPKKIMKRPPSWQQIELLKTSFSSLKPPKYQDLEG